MKCQDCKYLLYPSKKEIKSGFRIEGMPYCTQAPSLYYDRQIDKTLDCKWGEERRYMDMNNKFPENIMRILRKRRGLDGNDTSNDNLINTYSRSDAFAEVCTWNGLGYYDLTIKEWIKDIYGVELS